jgi:hypothetical protein
MNPKPSDDTRSKLSEETFSRCMDATLFFLKTNPSIRNSKLREITGIEYDQAITFFNRAILENTLLRKGSSSGTNYVLPNPNKN